MDKTFLSDFSEWESLNTDFSLYDYIFHTLRINGNSTDIFFAFSELFWPTLVSHDSFIFIKENYTENKYKDVKETSENVEFWMNMLLVDSYFQDDENRDVKAAALTDILQRIWQAKLKIDFPEVDFTVVAIKDEEVGDYGVTFYQKSNQCSTSS